MSALSEINLKCRTNKKGFILTETFGAAGYIFVDFGDEHLITDLDGKPCKQFYIEGVSQEENALVKVCDSMQARHNFQDGDYI
jgi:hypothetical protein